jgi:hypothetical protein
MMAKKSNAKQLLLDMKKAQELTVKWAQEQRLPPKPGDERFVRVFEALLYLFGQNYKFAK